MLQLIWIIIAFNVIIVKGACSGQFGTDPSCSRPCRCADNSDCDAQTGDCGTSGCGAGRPHGYRWDGPACQIGNVAYGFKEHTNQTGTYSRHISDLALDGTLATSGDYYCAHPLNPAGQNAGVPAEWTVDLRRPHKIYNVTLFAGYNNANGADRMTNFDINVISSSGTRLCARYIDPAPPGQGNVTVTCSPPLVGQYVHFIRTGGPRIDVATLCEVVVIGHLYADCSTISCPNRYCNEITGCSDCPKGKVLPGCTEDCPSGKHGYGCTHDCVHCKGANNECDPVNGSCTHGCEMWYAGDGCRKHIDEDGYNNENFMINHVTDDSVTLHWEQQPNKDDTAVQAQYYGYIVQYKESSSNSYSNYSDDKHNPQNTHRTTVVSGLKYNTAYDFRIRMYRQWEGVKYASSFNYPEKTTRTICKAPSTPVINKVERNIVSSDTGEVEIIVIFQLPSESGCGHINNRWLEYKTISAQSWTYVSLSDAATQYILRKPPGIYVLRITVANNQNINSSSSERQATILAPSATTPKTTPQTSSVFGNVPTDHKSPVTNPSNEPTVPGKSVDDPNDSSNGSMPIIVGAAVAVVVVAAIIVLTLVMLRRRGVIGQKTPKPSREDLKKSIRTMNDGKSVGQDNTGYSYDPNTGLHPTTTSDDAKEEENPYENTPERGPVSVSELESYVTRVKGSLLDEYKSLPEEDHSKCKLAETDENKPKNRFLNIHAYDNSRVVLDVIDDDPSTDYINANYIDGYQKRKAFIATQGPRLNTIYDFWRMVWMMKSNRIVMVTNLVENTKRKCDQYWPTAVGGTVAHGVFTITMDAEEVLADYTLRIMSIKKDGHTRVVRQFHYTSWEDKKRPLYGAAPILAFRRKVRSFDAQAKGPLVVHCSAGVGRTGTFLAIDILLGQAKAEEKVHFFDCVNKMRQNRMNMVQTKDQYVFLHEAVLEALKTGDVFYPCHGFQDQFESICQPSEELGGISEIERQFQLLDSLKVRKPAKAKDGWKDANKDKNRDADIVPADTDRPYLSARPGRGGTYINAVMVDGFRAHDSYVATQMPLPDTIADFWRLVYDINVNTIVTLDEIDHTDETCPQYWPIEVEHSQTYGPVEVKCLSEEMESSSEKIVVREFNVSLNSEKKSDLGKEPLVKTVRQYHLLGWQRNEEFPEDKGSLLDLQSAVQNFNLIRSSSNNGKPVKTIVQCTNGASRTGIFCTLTHVLEQMKMDQEIDIFTAVRYVANRRPQFIDTLDQYKFLYQMAIECIHKYDDYTNFR